MCKVAYKHHWEFRKYENIILRLSCQRVAAMKSSFHWWQSCCIGVIFTLEFLKLLKICSGLFSIMFLSIIHSLSKTWIRVVLITSLLFNHDRGWTLSSCGSCWGHKYDRRNRNKLIDMNYWIWTRCILKTLKYQFILRLAIVMYAVDEVDTEVFWDKEVL